ncbi:DUF7133 domain-containing protein [Ulvibacterium sp.]|uniref:DUF7133 domain-containing protein n=1 Tax=Ulvibacterium sp. TaxID=2665914 RepID=UPI003CC6853A
MKLIRLVFYCFVLLLMGCLGEHRSSSNSIAIKTIRKHMDTTIPVYDRYAIVKLPLDKGQKVWNPGVLELRSDNILFAANLTGEIYSLHDTNGDGIEDKAKLFCDVKKDGFRSPTGLAFKGRDLYVGLPQQIRVYRDLDNDDVADTSFVYFDQIPFSDHPYEYTTGLKFDDAGWLYFTLTTDSWNAGASPDPLKYRGAILKASPDGKTAKIVATGIRSVFGMAYDKEGELFFSDNEGGQNQTEELHILKEGSFYGHNEEKYGKVSVRQHLANLNYEVAPAEMQFVQDGGEEYLYVAYYGPGEYWKRGGVTRIKVNKLGTDSIQIQESPIADIPKAAGLAINDKGEIYVSSVGETDYWYISKEEEDGTIYKLIRQDWIKPKTIANKDLNQKNVDKSTIEKGAFIFAERACSSCHSIDGVSEMLGPDLKDISSVYDREELVEEIKYPSKRLKPGDFPTKITTVNNTVFLGRVLARSEFEVKIILIGNSIKTIPVNDIKAMEQLEESLMYTGLLNGLDEDEINSLVSYLNTL